MAIYDIFEHIEKQTEKGETSADSKCHFSEFTLSQEKKEEDLPSSKDRIFSSIAARLFFFMLWIADCAWGLFSLVFLCVFLALNILTGGKVAFFRKKLSRLWLNIKRAFICGISLFVALFSPALGTMFACTYFLMYDKVGIEEIVPSVLQDQFKEFFSPLSPEKH